MSGLGRTQPVAINSTNGRNRRTAEEDARASSLPLLCRFLDAGNNEALGTLSCQASKKRQGTKSREVGHRLGSERYGDLMSAPTLMVGATLPGSDRDVWTGEVRSLQWASRQALGAHQRALGALIAVIGSREITAGVEPPHRNGKVATLPAQPPPFVWHAHEMIYGVLCGGDCARAERRCLGATIWSATRAHAAIDFDSSGARGYRGREHYGPGRSWWSSLEA